MSTGLRRQSPPTPASRQRGAGLLLVALLMLIGVGLFIVNASTETARVATADTVVAQRLNAAKEALIAMAVAHPTRPGALPCPDTTGDGISDPPGPGACTRNLGHLPWLTLGIGDVRDSSGERLWYALSPNFRNVGPINSDTKGNREVRSTTAAVTATQTTEAVAVIFSPGGVRPGQARDSTVAACASTGTAIARNLCANNYLDSTPAGNNATTVGPYILADASATFNDRLVVLRTSDLIPLVERRVAADIRRVLLEYRNASRNASSGNGCNCYPWADGDNDGTGNTGDNKGRLPIVATPNNWGTTVQDGKGVVFNLPALPAYFQPNNWHTVIFYAVSRNSLQYSGLAPTPCATCTGNTLLPPPPALNGTLAVDQNIGFGVILITPGSAGASRPSTTWGDYIDDAANRDGDDYFVTPQAKSLDRDRLWTMPDDVAPASCNANAKLLITSAPCHTTGTAVKPVCTRASNNLYWCGCSGEAYVMVTPPCQNALSPPECEAAVASLQGCRK